MQYTVTEALVKLKLTDKKIADATTQTLVGYVTTQGNPVVPAGFKNVDSYRNEVKSRLDSVEGLIRFRDRLKKAIVESNARTSVTVGSKLMTVAEAVEAKTSVAFKKLLLQRLVGQMLTLENQVNTLNANVESKVDSVVQQHMNGLSSTDEERLNYRNKWLQANRATLVTHEKLRESINSLQKEIEDFESNVDVALSVVNAKTVVDVPE